MRRLIVLAMGAAAIGLVGAAPAMASTVTPGGPGYFTITAGSGQANDITVVEAGGNLVVTDAAGVTGCTPDTPTQVTCAGVTSESLTVQLNDLNDKLHVGPSTFGSSGIAGSGIFVNGGDGDDRIDISGDTSPIGPSLILGDGGNDTMTGRAAGTGFDLSGLQGAGPGNDVMTGGAGFDRFGGPGRDTMTGGASDDLFISGDAEPDNISCGEGSETATDLVDGLTPASTIGIDCERLSVPVKCPKGPADCVGKAEITASPAGKGKSAAAAKKRKKKKKKKGGPVVVARSEWTNLPGGVGGSLVYHPNEPVAYKTLGKRSEMPATVSLSVDLLKGFQQGKSKGEKVGRTKGKIQIKLRR